MGALAMGAGDKGSKTPTKTSHTGTVEQPAPCDPVLPPQGGGQTSGPGARPHRLGGCFNCERSIEHGTAYVKPFIRTRCAPVTRIPQPVTGTVTHFSFVQRGQVTPRTTRSPLYAGDWHRQLCGPVFGTRETPRPAKESPPPRAAVSGSGWGTRTPISSTASRDTARRPSGSCLIRRTRS